MKMPTLVATERMTQNEFGEWVDSPWARDWIGKIELLDGLVVCEPGATWEHSDVTGEIYGHLWTFMRRKRLGRVFESSCTVELPTGDTVVPDVTYISGERFEGRTESPKDFLCAVPELIIEISSPSTARRDRREKKRIYETNGVLEYWIVDREAREVLRYTLRAKRFSRARVFRLGDTVSSTVLEGFELPVREIFG